MSLFCKILAGIVYHYRVTDTVKSTGTTLVFLKAESSLYLMEQALFQFRESNLLQ